MVAYRGQVTITALAQGGFVAAWNASDEDHNVDIYAQRFTDEGLLIGGEFRVNTGTEGGQRYPQVISHPDGGFTIIWGGEVSTDPSGGGHDDGYGILGQRYNAAGAPVGGEFVVAGGLSSTVKAHTAGTSDGGFTVAWNDYGRTGKVQKFDSSGQPVGEPASFGTGEGSPATQKLASLPDGRFVVTWFEYSSTETVYKVYAQVYNADGTADADAFVVPASTDNDRNPVAAGLANGNIVIISDGYDGSPFDGYGAQNVLRIVDQNGDLVSSPVTLETSGQGWPEIVTLPDGGLFVTWKSDDYDDHEPAVLVGQYFDQSGNALGGPFEIFDDGFYPDAAVLDNGTIAVSTTNWVGEDYGSLVHIVVPGSDVTKTVYGAFGDDVITGTDAADIIDALTGDDFVDGAAGSDSLSGGEGNDTLAGGDHRDTLDGGRGGDSLSGGHGADTLDGGIGKDTLEGGAHSDQIAGGSGRDALSGESGSDALNGGAGHDTLDGGSGSDTLKGDTGSDTLKGGTGQDRLVGGSGADRIKGGSGHDHLSGGSGADRLIGGTGDDSVVSNSGTDRLWGGAGDDTLSGGIGSDTLEGGAGADCLGGGEGVDVFVFANDFGSDCISDFSVDVVQDRIDLSGVTHISDFADLVENHLSQSAAGALIDDRAGNTILIEGVSAEQLLDTSFIF